MSGHETPRGPIGRAFAAWEALIDRGIAAYVRALDFVLAAPQGAPSLTGVGLLLAAVLILGPVLRRDFFPEVDAGAFRDLRACPHRHADRAHRGADRPRRANDPQVVKKDLLTIISEIGVVADWSAAYTPNAGPMDAVVKVQLEAEREHSAQEYVDDAAREVERRVWP